MTELYLGTQGWSYRDWVGSFYRDGTQSKDYLAQYARAPSTRSNSIPLLWHADHRTCRGLEERHA